MCRLRGAPTDAGGTACGYFVTIHNPPQVFRRVCLLSVDSSVACGCTGANAYLMNGELRYPVDTWLGG